MKKFKFKRPDYDIKIAIIFLSVLTFFISSYSCRPKPAEKQIEEALPLQDTVETDTIVSIEPAYSEQAFDRLFFGMKKTEVSKLNKNPQRLGKYTYNFSYSYNGDGELYALSIFSASVKTIVYEDGLQGIYYNLHNIISMKYGNPSGPKSLPSIFDVMNTGTYWVNKWKKDTKVIRLGIRQRQQDSFDVVCTIVNVPMEKAEKERLFRIRNKDVIEAAEKF